MNHLRILQFYIKEKQEKTKWKDREREKEGEREIDWESLMQSVSFLFYILGVCVRRCVCVCLFWKLNNNNNFDCCDIQRMIHRMTSLRGSLNYEQDSTNFLFTFRNFTSIWNNLQYPHLLLLITSKNCLAIVELIKHLVTATLSVTYYK